LKKSRFISAGALLSMRAFSDSYASRVYFGEVAAAAGANAAICAVAAHTLAGIAVKTLRTVASKARAKLAVDVGVMLDGLARRRYGSS
jgi:hypothetical protein